MRGRQTQAAVERTAGAPARSAAPEPAPAPVSSEPAASPRYGREAQNLQRIHGNHRTQEGHELPADVRVDMERLFGADFSQVTVRQGAEPDAIGAFAYTAGTEIVLGADVQDLRSAAGQQVLAHELRHVLQQRDGRVPTTGGPIVEDPHLEHEAEEAGELAVSGIDADASMVGPMSDGARAQTGSVAVQPARKDPPPRPPRRDLGETSERRPRSDTDYANANQAYYDAIPGFDAETTVVYANIPSTAADDNADRTSIAADNNAAPQAATAPAVHNPGALAGPAYRQAAAQRIRSTMQDEGYSEIDINARISEFSDKVKNLEDKRTKGDIDKLVSSYVGKNPPKG
jgi:hypothetical protein